MRRPTSLTLRLTLLFGIAAVFVFSGFGWLIEDSIKRHFAEEDASELETISDAVTEVLFELPLENNRTVLARRLGDILVGHHEASLQIATPTGKIIYASRGPDLSTLVRTTTDAPSGGVTQNWSDGTDHFRGFVRSVKDSSLSGSRIYTIAVAVPIENHLRFLDNFRYTLWLMIASGIIIVSLAGWIAVRQGHAPLRDIISQIRSISANQLNTRLSPDTVPRELTDLAVSFNEMLGRMEEAFKRLSNFSADIAHDLRTPVTSMMTQTQVTLSQIRTVNEYQETLYSNIEEFEQMTRMINDMLFLAQADHGRSKPHATSVDLVREVKVLFEYYDAWAEERGVALVLDGAAIVTGDQLMLRRALGNLLSNAISHTSSGETVRVKLDTSDNEYTSILVENPGAEISPEHLPRLFDRFYRIDRSRPEGGTGLGLAIVKTIVTAHGGTIGVTSSHSQTSFWIMLPKLSTRLS